MGRSKQKTYPKMSTSLIRRQRKKLARFRSIAASDTARVLGDVSFFEVLKIESASDSESRIGRFLGKKTSLYTTECVKAASDFESNGTNTALCPHLVPVPPNDCVVSVVGSVNRFKFILATASEINAKVYTEGTRRPVILVGPEGNLSVYANETNANGDDELVEGDPKKKSILHRFFRVKAIRENEKAKKNKAASLLLKAAFQKARNRSVTKRMIHKSEPAAGSDQNDEDVDKTRVMPKDIELTQACPRNEKKSRKAMLEQRMELIPEVSCGTIKNSKNGVEALAVDQKGSSDEE